MLGLLQWMQRHRKSLRIADFLLGMAVTLYGWWAQSWFWGMGGLLMLAVSWWNPLKKIPLFFESRIKKPVARHDK